MLPNGIVRIMCPTGAEYADLRGGATKTTGTQRRGLRALFHQLIVLGLGATLPFAAGVVKPARVVAGPVSNAGFETGNLSSWTTSCAGEAGGCDNWSITVGADYARSGLYGVRLFIAQLGHYGGANLVSEPFIDSAETYIVPMNLVGGATAFYSGVIVQISDSQGFVQYRGNTQGSVFCFPNPAACEYFTLIPGVWEEYIFAFQQHYQRKYDRLPDATRRVQITAYQDDDFVELYVDDVFTAPSDGLPKLTWAETNQWGQFVVTGINDSDSMVDGACLDWSHLLSEDAPLAAYALEHDSNSMASEFGGLFHVENMRVPRFDVWVLARDGGPLGTPPPEGVLQMRIRKAHPELEQGFDPASEIPLIQASTVPLEPSLGAEPCWRHARVTLSEPLLEGDYWFTVSWSVEMSNTFELVFDVSQQQDGLVILSTAEGGPQWQRGVKDPMIVVLGDPINPFYNQRPMARIDPDPPSPGQTGFPVTLDASTSTPGKGPNTYTDQIELYGWGFITCPTCPGYPNCPTINYNPYTPTASFTPMCEGTYEIQLRVEDSCCPGCSAAGDPYCCCPSGDLVCCWFADTKDFAIIVKQTASPSVGAPTMTPSAGVHAEDTQTPITFSATVSDPNCDPNCGPHLTFEWRARWCLNRVCGEVPFSYEPPPTIRTRGQIGLGDLGREFNTAYDIFLKVRNGTTGLSTTGPMSKFRIGRWPRISNVTAKISNWNQPGHFTFKLPVDATLAVQGVGLNAPGAVFTLRHLNSGGFVNVPVNINEPPGGKVEKEVPLFDTLIWDPYFCYTIVPLGPLSVDERYTIEVNNLTDFNTFNLGRISSAVQNTHVEVPLCLDLARCPKTFDWAIANLEYFKSLVTAYHLGGAIATCFVCGPCCIVPVAYFSIKLASELLSWHHHCNKAHDDPPSVDREFMTIVPLEIPLTDVTAGCAPEKGLQRSIGALEHGILVAAVHEAYDKTFNKLFGAYEAGDLNWMLAQGTELVRWGAVLDAEMGRHIPILRAAQDSKGQPSLEQVILFQSQIASEGLPPEAVEALTQRGLTQDEIDSFAERIVDERPATIASGIPPLFDELIPSLGSFYKALARNVGAGEYILVAVTSPLRDQPVLGTITIDARAVHKKHSSIYCTCGPTLLTELLLDGKPLNTASYPSGPWCPPTVGFLEAVPVQVDTAQALGDGGHTITVYATDSGLCLTPGDPREHANNDTINFYVDNTPPTLTVSSPDVDPLAPGIQVYSGPDIRYVGEDPPVNDYSSGLVDLFQGSIQTVRDITSPYDVTICVADRAGNSTTALVQVLPFPSGDCDGDHRVDAYDVAQFQNCYTGANGGPIPPRCACVDLDRDVDVDLNDWGLFVPAITGP